MTITTTFDPPLPSDSPAVFNSKAFTLLGDLNDFSTEANALQADVNAKQTTASAAATTATTAKNAAEAALDSFDDRYLGPKAANPTLDNDGNALLTGALHWNTTAAEMRVWTGSAWTALNATTGIAQAIAVNSASAALTVTQTGAGNAFVVEDSASTDATPFVIDANGNTVVGHTASATDNVTGQLFQVHANAAIAGAGATVAQWSATQSGALNLLKSASGTVGTNGAVAAGASTAVRFFFDDGTDFIRGATIEAAVDGTPGTNDMPGRLVFSTTEDGASTPTEAMRIDSAQRIGIGGAAAAGTSVRIGKSITGGATSQAINANGAIQSDVTGAVQVYRSSPATAAAAFVLGALDHFLANPQTFGAGSIVTNQIGFSAASSLTGATNNYGFYGNIAAAAGRWNFYANGTAANYFAGTVFAGSNTAVSGTAGEAQVQSESLVPYSARYGGVDASAPIVEFLKTRNGAILASGDGVGQIRFSGWDGAAYLRTAQITSEVDGTPGVNDMPGRLIFSTTADGAATPTERFRIGSTGLATFSNGLQIARTAVTAPASTDGNVFSGTYTPTLTNVANTSARTASVCQYMRVGDTITVSGQVAITPTAAAGTTTTIRISLPVASAMTLATNLAGTGVATNVAAQTNAAGISAETTNDEASFSFFSQTTSALNFFFAFTYRVI